MINSTTFIKDVILFLRDNLRSNITDPLSRGANFVMTSYPEKDVRYPLITIKAVDLDTRSLGMASMQQWVTLSIEVRVWARNEKEKDGLTSLVVDQLRTIQYGSGGTNSEGIYGFRLTSAVPIEEEGTKTAKSMVMNFEYSSVLS